MKNIIYLGSESKVKFNALNRALLEVFHPDQYMIIQRNVDSNVSAQPLGDETLRGATNRCIRCMFGYKYTPGEQVYCIGVENGLYIVIRDSVKNIDGIVEQGNTELNYIDKAVVVVRKLGEETFEETIWESASIPVKEDFVPNDRDNYTWGDSLALVKKNSPTNLIVNSKDPHYTVCGISREDILYDTFKMIVRSIIA